MATNGNNLEPEFDALLKAHVKQHANVAVCHQFNPDDATAYLERALSQTALASFETHLASCAICRRHLIELSRLMPAQPLTVEPIIETPTVKSRWSEWFSGWRLGAFAGLSAVAATVLFLAVFIQRQSLENAAPMVATNKEVAQVTPAATSSSPTSLSDETKRDNKGIPSVSASASPLPVDKLERAKTAPAEAAVAGATATTSEPTTAAPPPPPAPTPAPKKEESERKEIAGQSQGTGGLVATQNQANNFRVQTPSGPETNQLQAERALEARKRNEQIGQTTKDSAAPSAAKPVSKSAEVAEDRQVEKSKANRDDEVDKKSTAKAAPRPASTATMDRAARSPARLVGGKTFIQTNGVWVDEDYSANRNLPVVRLTRDSDVYKQTLKDTPALKPYFDLKPVIVVWQGKVYRVENK